MEESAVFCKGGLVARSLTMLHWVDGQHNFVLFFCFFLGTVTRVGVDLRGLGSNVIRVHYVKLQNNKSIMLGEEKKTPRTFFFKSNIHPETRS